MNAERLHRDCTRAKSRADAEECGRAMQELINALQNVVNQSNTSTQQALAKV